MNERDRMWVTNMLHYVVIARRIVQGTTRDLFERDVVLQLALAKAVELVGEAAAEIRSPTRTLYPHIPWKLIASMRNVRADDYFRIDLDVVWEAASHDLPALIVDLEKILAPDETPDSG